MKRNINPMAVLVAAIIDFGLGAVWFTVFANPWIAGTGMPPEQITYYQQHPSFVAYFIALLCNVVMAYAIAWTLGELHERNVLRGVGVGAVLGVVAGMAMFTEQTFEFRPLLFKLISAGYPLLGCMIMGAVIGIWKKGGIAQSADAK